jgi:hypothetical protein
MSPRRLTPSEREAALGVLTILLEITHGCHPRLVRHIRGAYDSIRHSGERDQQWLDRNYEPAA